MRQGELADRALARVIDGIPQRERAFAQELTYGVLRMRGRIDHRLSQVVTRPLREIEADALDALRIGAYQLLDLNGIPPYAAVSESVELVKPRGSGVAGFVNGVLKGLQRARDLRFPSLERDPAGYLTTWGSHPRWLVERWLKHYGAEGAAALVEADNRRPELCIQPLTMSAEDAVAKLAAEGLAADVLDTPTGGIRLTHGDVAHALRLVPGIVQDPAARLVTRYVEPDPGDVVLDLCAAPGGKALGLAQQAAYVAAADLSFARLGRVRENFARLREQDVQVKGGMVVADARRPPFGRADIVFIDAPCTGTGTLRRHPDGRWRLQPGDLKTLVELQREILSEAVPLVPVGGLLVYATCSLEPEENELQMEWLRKMDPRFEPAPPASFPVRLDRRGQLRVLPHEHGFDGAFAARLRRVR